MKKLLTHCLVGFLVYFLFIGVLNAAAFMKIKGVEGESTDTSHQGEIDVLAWRWGAHRSVELKSGRGDSPKIGKTIGSMEINFAKLVDTTTPVLMQACANGEHIDEAVLTVRKAGEEPVEYYVITMKKVMVTSVATSSADETQPLMEEIVLNFREVDVHYLPQKEDGSVGEPIEYQWSISKSGKP
ncbi:protein hcp1 [Thalassotalea insulae]|uniref:Protein hcp1 n=1 Tax=Thalassotalea insulae TaxID=2056778 RepID=A0ABQ6GMA0_9GAMM|nr:type VI secretion system tube protein Hcp [Thalassotalea insulae]GLX77113.1 protein hcp1 [Thalassotalea insulae]